MENKKQLPLDIPREFETLLDKALSKYDGTMDSSERDAAWEAFRQYSELI
jgi:hypothetical protein